MKITNILGDSSIGSHDQHRSHVSLQGAVQEGETLNIQHMYFVYEEHARHNLRFTLLSPFSYFSVDLLAHLWLDFSRITCITNDSLQIRTQSRPKAIFYQSGQSQTVNESQLL